MILLVYTQVDCSVLLYSATFPTASPMTGSVFRLTLCIYIPTPPHMINLIVKEFAIDTVYLLSCGIATVCALYQCKTPDVAGLVNPKILSYFEVYP